MDAVSDILARQDRPAWVRFERVAVENKPETIRQGKWVGQDVDMVLITPAYSKDEVVKKVSVWLDQIRTQVAQGRLSQSQMDRYLGEYAAWKNGQELPVNGTPIKGWGVISPAQQQVLLSAKIRTVEDLAGMNDEGIRMVGMGSVELKQKAVAWLAQLQDKGPLTVELAAVKAENAALKISMETLTKQVETLVGQVRASMMVPPIPIQSLPIEPATTQVDVAEAMDQPEESASSEPPAVKRRAGNPNWVKKNKETPA